MLRTLANFAQKLNLDFNLIGVDANAISKKKHFYEYKSRQ